MEIPPPPSPSRQGRGSFHESPIRASRKLPYFSRSQLGVILLLGAALLGLYAWRAHLLFAPGASPPGLMPPTFAEVVGKVDHPGVYAFPGTPTLGEVWQEARGLQAAPAPDQKIASGSRVEVTPEGGYKVGRMAGSQLLVIGLPIDLNQATAADLEAVPGLGPALAQRIVDYRNAHGPFKKLEDLEQKVLGIGPKKLADIKPYLSIGEPASHD
jgi:competence ComEA-like helix-hairpin-helix protein